MNKYLEGIQSLDSVGTGVQEQSLPDSTLVLEMSGEAPSLTYIESPVFTEKISQDCNTVILAHLSLAKSKILQFILLEKDICNSFCFYM